MKRWGRLLRATLRAFARHHPEVWVFIVTSVFMFCAVQLVLHVPVLKRIASYNSPFQVTVQGVICLYSAGVCIFAYCLMVPTRRKMRLDWLWIGFIFSLGWLFTKAGTAALWNVGGMMWGTTGFLLVAVFGTGLIAESMRERLSRNVENPWKTIEDQAAYIRELEAMLQLPHQHFANSE